MPARLLAILVVTLVVLGPLPSAIAAEATVGKITIPDPWARASTGGGRPAAAYLSIRNDGAEDRLMSAWSPVAGKVEIHQSKMEGGVMKMVGAAPLRVPAGATVEMKPGGYHIMLMGLKRPLKKGQIFPITLTFEKAGTVEVQVEVKSAGAMHGGMGH